MEYTYVGRTGLAVSRLALGTMNFKAFEDESQGFRILDYAVERGINLVDTADVYGGPDRPGYVENLVGDWIQANPVAREKVLVATKVYGKTGPGPNDRGLSAYHIIKACEASLKRLKTDHIDIFQMHHVDRNTSWDEIWLAMENLVGSGKILYVGSCNFAAWHIVEALEAAARRGFPGMISEQSIYNLCQRTIELEVLPACAKRQIGVFAWSPLQGGLLAAAKPGGSKAQGPALQQWTQLCGELGAAPASVALAWILGNPAVTAPIIGASACAHIDDALRALEMKLDGPTLQRIDAIWPGPGKPAPEAYAW